jgi:hypothetical protein
MGRDQEVWSLPVSWRPCKLGPVGRETGIRWGGKELLSVEQKWARRHEVIFIIYFWFIFGKLREFL